MLEWGLYEGLVLRLGLDLGKNCVRKNKTITLCVLFDDRVSL